MKNQYSLDFVKNTLTISERFNKRAMNPDNDEYAILLKFKNDFPGLRIYIKPAPKRKNASAQLTYTKMVKYLACQPDGERLLLMFKQICELATSSNMSYQYVKKWFLEQFPEYLQYPSFDENGKMVNPRGTAKAETAQKTTALEFSNTAA